MSKYRLITALAVSALFLGACEESDTVEDEVTETEVAAPDDTEETEKPETILPEEIEDLHVSDVRNDTTGNWRKVVDSHNFNMPENAIDYYNEYMEDDEIHYLVSFATNTTTMINNLGGTLYVDVTEYVDREEHSSDTIGGGMLLKSYQVNLESGEITEVE